MKMTPKCSNGTLDGQTCLCCMCRCGDHKCFQQLVMKLPVWMQNELKLDRDKQKQNGEKDYEHQYQADLYQKTTYKRDFCEQQDIIDRYPLDQNKPITNLEPFSKFGYATKNNVYRDDFIPWTRNEQELCRAKLHVPDHELRRNANNESGYSLECPKKISDKDYNYYCPPHCIGDQKEQMPENCLIYHKDRFNLGPPAQKRNLMPEKSHHPFANFTNYMLDYKGGTVSLEKKSVPKYVDVNKAICPLSSDTSYRRAFTCPPKMDSKPTKTSGSKDQKGTLTVGDGPMVQQTTSMLDFKDPDVSANKPARPPREPFQPPPCRMETTTTTGRTYQKWKDFPRPEITKKEKHLENHKVPGRGTRHLLTTYQEDFDGLNSALCPCRVVEKYGPKVLEPRYMCTESNKSHDIFRFKKSSESGGKDCPH